MILTFLLLLNHTFPGYQGTSALDRRIRKCKRPRMVLQQKCLVQTNDYVCSMGQLRVSDPPEQRRDVLDDRDGCDVME